VSLGGLPLLKVSLSISGLYIIISLSRKYWQVPWAPATSQYPYFYIL